MSTHIAYHFVLLVTAVSTGRIDPLLKEAVDHYGETQAIIELPEIINKISGLDFKSGDAKVNHLVTSMKALTYAMQAPLVNEAESLGLTTEQFWIANIIKVRNLTPEKLSQLATTSGDFIIRLENTVKIDPTTVQIASGIGKSVQWGVSKINAPEAWSVTRGEGIIVGTIDTGVNLGHVALTDGYAGAWFDPHHSTPLPTDVRGHGSYVMGTILGRLHGIGVAPGAKWIACRGLNHTGVGHETELTSCAQFFLRSNPRPHIISNSWGGAGGGTWFNSQISAWRKVGIIPVFGIGNGGPSCGSVNSPGDQRNVISVGATTETDGVTWDSPRGPNKVGKVKPEVSAPGSNIVSCGTGTNDYVTISGTSVATSHVSGAIALLLSANHSRGFDEVFDALTKSASKPALLPEDRKCGLPTNQDFPNNAYGHGRIDVAGALGLSL